MEKFSRKAHGVVELYEADIKHNILVVKINRLYQKNMSEYELYECTRGIWRASMERVKSVDYVFGVYNSLIVAVYKPTEWYRCKDEPTKRPRQYEALTPQTEDRLFFVDKNFENGLPLDDDANFYYGKSMAGLNHGAQNPITYLNFEE